MDRSTFWQGVEVRERTIDGKLVTLIHRARPAELVIGLEPDPEKRKGLDAAVDEFGKLWLLCRQYATDAPPINPKGSTLVGGSKGHDGLSEERLSFGAEVHERYQGAIKAMCPQRDATGRAIISNVIAVCIENKPATEPLLALKGIKIMADFFGF